MQVCPNQRLRTFRGTIKRQSRTIFKMDKSFIFFIKLPTVLRLKIWHQALPLFPGILEARPLSPSQATSKTLAWTIIPTKNLTLLSINQESRYELAKFYATPFEPTAIFPTSDISLRINYAVDILFIDTTGLSCMWGRIHTFTEFFRAYLATHSPIFSESFDFSRQVKICGTWLIWRSSFQCKKNLRTSLA